MVSHARYSSQNIILMIISLQRNCTGIYSFNFKSRYKHGVDNVSRKILNETASFLIFNVL